MKTAEHWLESFKDSECRPFHPSVDDIQSIQADAIEHCLQISTALLPDTQHSFRQLHRERIKLLEAKPQKELASNSILRQQNIKEDERYRADRRNDPNHLRAELSRATSDLELCEHQLEAATKHGEQLRDEAFTLRGEVTTLQSKLKDSEDRRDRDSYKLDEAEAACLVKDEALLLAKDVTSHGFLPNPKTGHFNLTHFDVHATIDAALSFTCGKELLAKLERYEKSFDAVVVMKLYDEKLKAHPNFKWFIQHTPFENDCAAIAWRVIHEILSHREATNPPEAK